MHDFYSRGAKVTKVCYSAPPTGCQNEPSLMKYTNPARGILDYCKQKFCRPLLCRQLSNQPSADFSGTERKKEEKEHGETIKGPPPGGA